MNILVKTLTAASPFIFALAARSIGKHIIPQTIRLDIILIITLIMVLSVNIYFFISRLKHHRLIVNIFLSLTLLMINLVAILIFGVFNNATCGPPKYYIEGVTQAEYEEYQRQQLEDIEEFKNMKKISYTVKKGQYKGKTCM